MNIMQMVKQAQDMQKKLKEAQDELAKTDVVGEAADGAVKVTCDGQGKFKSIKLTAAALNPDDPDSVDPEVVTMVEDIVTIAILQASMKATKLMEDKMKAVSGGLKMPGLF